MAEFQPSPYQIAIANQAADMVTSFHVEANAGSGKTTTLVNIGNSSQLREKFLFAAFSRLIAEELKKRLPDNDCSTLHSAGWKVFKKHRPMIRRWQSPDKNKVVDMLRAHLLPLKDKKKRAGIIPTEYQQLLMQIDEENERGAGLWMVQEFISKLMVTKTKPLPDDIEAMADTYNINLLLPAEQMSEVALRILADCRLAAFNEGLVNFDEMIYWPTEEQWPVGNYHTVAIDEVQDLNAMQHDFLALINRERVITVGDRNQSIFGFAGAMSDSVDQLIHRFDLKQLPLSICYRCGKDIVRHAQQIVPEIEYFDKNHEGVVREIEDNELIRDIQRDYETHKDNKNHKIFIICRLNAPLISKCFHLIMNGVAARIRGRDISEQLVQTIYQLSSRQGFSIDNFEYFLDWYYTNEVAKIYQRGGRRVKVLEIMLKDKVQCLRSFYQEIKPLSLDELIDGIKRIFVDDKFANVTLLSAHKSKGLEAQSVYVIEPHKLPLRYNGQTEEEARQERNLTYVVRTRAINVLTYVNPLVDSE
jgi:superfamily I DNA/RNA helicase